MRSKFPKIKERYFMADRVIKRCLMQSANLGLAHVGACKSGDTGSPLSTARPRHSTSKHPIQLQAWGDGPIRWSGRYRKQIGCHTGGTPVNTPGF